MGEVRWLRTQSEENKRKKKEREDGKRIFISNLLT
jgi:hypothetical protein